MEKKSNYNDGEKQQLKKMQKLLPQKSSESSVVFKKRWILMAGNRRLPICFVYDNLLIKAILSTSILIIYKCISGDCRTAIPLGL